MKRRSIRFLYEVKQGWSIAGQQVVGNVVRDQLTGRKGDIGLNRRTGNAARVLNTITEIIDFDVVQTFFLVADNPAKNYLPIHDASRKKAGGDFGRGIIRARNAPYLVFRTDDGAWHTRKKVKMPQRVNILAQIEKDGRRLRFAAIKQALRRAERG